MPRATNNVAETHRRDLKTVEGGYVVARRLSYGEKIERRAMVSGFKVEGGKGKDFAGEMQLMNEKANLYDFQHCVVESNLTKPNPQEPDNEDADLPLDFTNANDLKSLAAHVGEEISEFLDELNNFEDDSEN
jgi:hypothetical protein